MRTDVPWASKRILQEVPVRTVPSGKPPGSLPAQSSGRRDCDKDDREQTRCRGLPDLDVLLPEACAKPKLLPSARREPSPLVRSLVRSGGEYDQRPCPVQGESLSQIV